MKELRWEDIYRYWQDSLEDLGTPTDELAPFQDIYVDRLPYYLSSVGLDWWPKKEVPELAASLLKDSPYLPCWETKKAPFTQYRNSTKIEAVLKSNLQYG